MRRAKTFPLLWVRDIVVVVVVAAAVVVVVVAAVVVVAVVVVVALIVVAVVPELTDCSLCNDCSDWDCCHPFSRL